MRSRAGTVNGGCCRVLRLSFRPVIVTMFTLAALAAQPAFSQTATPQQSSVPQTQTVTADELNSLRQKAHFGDVRAQHALGRLCLNGEGVPIDKAEALKWFALEAARADGDERPALRSAFDRLAATVGLSEMAEALMRADLWAIDYNRRSPSQAKLDASILMSVFGATWPRLTREVKPVYTRAALDRKIEGDVEHDCVVKADGTVGECQLVLSLDSVYGLDQEALKAARKWRFVPATVRNRPVPIVVTINLTFTMK